MRRINEELTGRFYQLQGASELAQRLQAENADLKQQLSECRPQVQPTTILPVDHPKVTSLERKRTGRSNISEQVKQQLDSLGIQLNSTLTKALLSASEGTILDAISALKEALTDGDIDKPGGWLKAAIEQGWKPNGKIKVKSELEVFNQWYPKAKQKKLIQASQTTEEGVLIYTNDQQWIPFSKMLEQHPLETL